MQKFMHKTQYNITSFSQKITVFYNNYWQCDVLTTLYCVSRIYSNVIWILIVKLSLRKYEGSKRDYNFQKKKHIRQEELWVCDYFNYNKNLCKHKMFIPLTRVTGGTQMIWLI